MDSRTGLPVVGMVGGGQLARMTHQAAIALGQSLRVLALDPDDGAALVAADVPVRRRTPTWPRCARSPRAATWSPSTTSTCPSEHIRALAAEGVTRLPGADALLYAQDKRRDAGAARRAGRAGAALAPGHVAPRTWRAFGDEIGWPVVLKAARGGYDGRGVWVRRRDAGRGGRRCSPAAPS